MNPRRIRLVRKWVAEYATQLNGKPLDGADLTILLDTITYDLTHGVVKFVAGAQSHNTPILSRAPLADLREELFDARIYCTAAIAKCRTI